MPLPPPPSIPDGEYREWRVELSFLEHLILVITLQVQFVCSKKSSSMTKGKVSGLIGVEREGLKERKLPWAVSQKSPEEGGI